MEKTTQAEPIVGYPEFFEAISKSLKYPLELTEKGKVFVLFTKAQWAKVQ